MDTIVVDKNATRRLDGNGVRGYRLCGRVVDGTLDPPIEDGVVVTEGERIVWVGEQHSVPPQFATESYAEVALDGRTIMPGIIDGHTHISFGDSRSEEENALYTPVEFRTLKAIWNAKKVLQSGVTSAFDAATTYNIAQSVRDAIDTGMFEGPRFVVSGKQITNHQGLEDSFPNNMAWPEGQAAVLVKTKDDLIEAIRYQVKDEVDCIKVSGSNDNLITPDSLDVSAFSFDELKIVADESHRLGKLCATHARSRSAIRDAAKAGFDILFHASYIDDEGIDYALKNKCVITPTLTLLVNIMEANKGAAGASFLDSFRREVDAAQVGIRKAYDAGVPVIAGTESGWSPVPFGEWHGREMQIFVDLLGFSPLEAIHASTLTATKVLPRFGKEVGKLEPGRLADILVVNGDPTKDIRVLQQKSRFDHILKGGREIDRTPIQPRREKWYEKHKIFLNGRLRYDETTGQSYLTQ